MKRLLPFFIFLSVASSGWAQSYSQMIYNNTGTQAFGTIQYTAINNSSMELSYITPFNINSEKIDLNIPSTIIYEDKIYNVTSIGSNAFSSGLISSINIPNSITNIADGAFSNCSFTSINLLDGLDYSKTGLTIYTNDGRFLVLNSKEVSLLNGHNISSELKTTGWGYEFSIISIEQGAGFSIDGIGYLLTNEQEVSVTGFGNISDVIIPSNVECVNNYAVTAVSGNRFTNNPADFNNTTESISIPNSVKTINDMAFQTLSNLKYVNISNKDTKIGKDVFKYCTALKEYSGPAQPFNEFNSSETSSYSTLFEKITLTSGTLDRNGLDYINLSYRTLQEIDLSGIENPEISDMAFNNCYKLEKVTLPEDLQSIGYKSFAGCTALKGISIPASVTKIDNSAFEDCRKMEQINFDGSILKASISNLETIGDWAFYNCHNLKFLEIPEGVTSIGDAAFYGCTYLQDLKLPSTLKSMGDNSFAMCENLKSLTVMAEEPPSLYEKSFYNVDHSIPVTVPAPSLKSYEETDYWNEFFHLKAADATITDNVSATNTIFVSNGKIIVNGEAPSFVITATGQKIANQNLKFGVYFAMIEGHTIKIVIE